MSNKNGNNKNNTSESSEITKDKKVSSAKKMGKWFRDLKAETKKIIWPDGKQVVNKTSIVLLIMFAIGSFIWVLDAGIKMLFDGLLKL